MQTHNLGYPRIGSQRELKKACELYWSGKLSLEELRQTGKMLRAKHWKLQQEAGIDLIPSNDFSFYDHVLDMSLSLRAIPPRYRQLISDEKDGEPELYFAMARGYQRDGLDITAMEMTKWFDTNYHYIVPEFYKDQQFAFFSRKIIDEFEEAVSLGLKTKPVLVGPVSYLLLGKEKEEGFHKLDLIDRLLPVYLQILDELRVRGATWVQFDEPFLALDLNDREKEAYQYVYQKIRASQPSLKLLLATYFEGLKDNLPLAVSLPADALHLDLVRSPEQFEEVTSVLPGHMQLSLGLVDGRNIWKNDLQHSLSVVRQAVKALGSERVMIAPSCSLLHVPCDLDLESDEEILSPEIKQWLAFARQKIGEVVTLKALASAHPGREALEALAQNQEAVSTRKSSVRIHNEKVKQRVAGIEEAEAHRKNGFSIRQHKQHAALKLPLFPTTTIGSFPQTKEVRSWRAKYKKGLLTGEEYESLLKQEIEKAIRWQEEAGIDVLVHGEFERNDMVEYFGEQLAGFTFTRNGWVQSYGTRCVKPPIIYGDVYRPRPMTVRWAQYAQSLTDHRVKGMLTGPVTILQWSFVRNDQPHSRTCDQIALAIRDEVADLEQAGIKIIQIDEPAIREGLPLRKAGWPAYLKWAVRAFRIASSGVKDETQIHTHMCYSEFNDIIEHIADMDADVITIECSRSQMELLEAFAAFQYPNEIGPGVYDIHSPRIPSEEEMLDLLEKARAVIPAGRIWVNPDCGLKTRQWDEVRKALTEMVAAAGRMRKQVKETTTP